MRYICYPGKAEIEIENICNQLNVKSELWPELDRYDIKIFFGNTQSLLQHSGCDPLNIIVQPQLGQQYVSSGVCSYAEATKSIIICSLLKCNNSFFLEFSGMQDAVLENYLISLNETEMICKLKCNNSFFLSISVKSG